MTTWPPLPRDVEADPCAPALRDRLAARVAPLWREAAIAVPTVPLVPRLAVVLAGAARDGTLTLGLEAAAAALDAEERGLATQAARAGAPRATRISRVLLLADDGAERFYRGVERLVRRHAGRLLVCRLDVAADALGRAVLDRPAAVKAVLVQRKGVVSAVLRAIAAD